MIDTKHENQIANFHQSFANKLPDRFDQMKKTWQEVIEHDWSAIALSQLWEQAHKLSGSAVLYGFNDVSDQCYKIEKAIEQNSLKKPSSEVIEQIEELILGLKK